MRILTHQHLVIHRVRTGLPPVAKLWGHLTGEQYDWNVLRWESQMTGALRAAGMVILARYTRFE